jgi:oligosaccharide repeat unit polymerase
MFYHLCALAFIVLALGLAAIRRCSLYSPLVISATIWLVVFIVGLLAEEGYYPIQEKAFIAWLIWFMVTSVIFFLLYPSSMKSTWIRTEIRRIPVDYTLPLLFLIVWLCYQIWVIGSSGPESFFSNLRMSAVNPEDFTSLGSVILRSYPLVFALFLFEHVYAHRENRHLRLLLWCFMLLFAIAVMSKNIILTPFLSWIIIQGITGRLNFSRIALLVAVVFSFMMSLQFIRGDSGFYTIWEILSLYIYSPIVALGYLDIDSSLPIGAYVFRFFYAIGNILDIGPQPVKAAFAFVQVPGPTNVFTVMGTFFHDFGLLGVTLEAVLFGLFFSFLYYLSVKRGGLWLVLFSGYSIPLVMQFFAELLFLGFSNNLQLLLYSLAIFLVSRKVSNVS